MKNMKKRNSGFTLVEIMIVIVIIGILSATVSINISPYVLERRGEQNVVAFYNQLQQMRAYAQRNDARYLVRLQTTAPAFEIFMDVDKDYICDPEEKVQLFPDQNTIANIIQIGQGNATLVAMATSNSNIYDVSDNIIGEWNTNTKIKSPLAFNAADNGGFTEVFGAPVTMSNTIVFENDALGTINSGILFIENNNRLEVCYAIVRPLHENMLRLWKWKNGAWAELL